VLIQSPPWINVINTHLRRLVLTAHSSFDALIDLLASDDIHDVAVSPSGPSLYSLRHTVHLRDASGKLDLIRSVSCSQSRTLVLLMVGLHHDTMQSSLLVQCESDPQDVCT
jgi:hypothetical protein